MQKRSQETKTKKSKVWEFQEQKHSHYTAETADNSKGKTLKEKLPRGIGSSFSNQLVYGRNNLPDLIRRWKGTPGFECQSSF